MIQHSPQNSEKAQDQKNNHKTEAIAFTDRGEALADKLMDAIGGRASRSGRPRSMKEWVKEVFESSDALVFVGAAGIAVRAISPYVDSKTKDPAVVVVDEEGRFVIPILSGHLGGANDLARHLAGICGGEAVITTATDVRGVFAVDEWTKRQNCEILEPEKIREISSAILSGKTLTLRSEWEIKGTVPEGLMMTDAEEADIALDVVVKGGRPIHAVPVICTLGVGCRRGTEERTLENFLRNMLLETGISEKAIEQVASIDIKADEPGLKKFCERHGWDLVTFDAAQLEKLEGEFTSSNFVNEVTGVDNVCERSAVLASSGRLIQRKISGSGVTMAIAMRDYRPTWRWTDE